ncbi:far1-related sequence 6 -like protein [Gossypium arboreum]|uniref:Protein FAR1-RELATED SEQUENCE n=1 Tax=Gossypium arboreum TaxID=29729 RepID=A0A0B0MXF2_GOSAR|nr:far1-related sequence 6 -like protein [Gossypium arboreum]
MSSHAKECTLQNSGLCPHDTIIKLVQMEEVCLNSEPVFDMVDEYEVEGDCSAVEHDDETGSKHSKKEPPLPTIGLEFDSFDEAYDYYNIYAKEQGFGIRVSNSWFRTKKKERYRAKLSCSSAGFKKKSEANNPRPETRTGCPAMVVIRLVDSKRWRIVEVELEHNHQVSPQIKRFYKSHKKMILAARKARPPAEPVTEIHTIKLYRTAAMDAVSNGFSNVSEREAYTKEIFDKFQSEVEGMYSCFNTRQVTANGPIVTYIVKERVEIEGNEKEVRSYEVLFETNQVDIRCICSLFNYKGYLCRHALNVLNYNGVEEVPSRYILRRWCKDFKFQHVDRGSTDIDVYSPVDRQSHFHNYAVPIVEGGAQSEEQYKIALHELQELLNKFNLVDDSLV